MTDSELFYDAPPRQLRDDALPAEQEPEEEEIPLEREGLWLFRRDWDARTVEVWDRPTPRLA